MKQIERSLRNDRKFPTTENYNCMTFDLKDAEEKNINAKTMTKNCVWNCLEKPIRELHEEIMWIAEAAHLPVIWATQVLENLAKKGQPSRAEITDAAMAERAEWVMLNKGRYMVEALRVLADVLRRMQKHQAKKAAFLRPLNLAERFFREQASGSPKSWDQSNGAAG